MMGTRSTIWRKSNPAKARAAQQRDYAKKREQRRDAGIPQHGKEVKCVECGTVLEREAAILQGFKFMPRDAYHGLCHTCRP